MVIRGVYWPSNSALVQVLRTRPARPSQADCASATLSDQLDSPCGIWARGVAMTNREFLERDPKLLWGLGISADILVWARDEFDRRLSLKASLPATVVREGMLLHAA